MVLRSSLLIDPHLDPLQAMRAYSGHKIRLSYNGKNGASKILGTYSEEIQNGERAFVQFETEDGTVINIVPSRIESLHLYPAKTSEYGPSEKPVSRSAAVESTPLQGHMCKVAFMASENFLGSITILSNDRRTLYRRIKEIARISGHSFTHVEITYKGRYEDEETHVNPRFTEEGFEPNRYDLDSSNAQETSETIGDNLYKAILLQTRGVFVGSALIKANSLWSATNKAHAIAVQTGIPCSMPMAKELSSIGANAHDAANEDLYYSTLEEIVSV